MPPWLQTEVRDELRHGPGRICTQLLQVCDKRDAWNRAENLFAVSIFLPFPGPTLELTVNGEIIHHTFHKRQLNASQDIDVKTLCTTKLDVTEHSAECWGMAQQVELFVDTFLLNETRKAVERVAGRMIQQWAA